jgi:hypothetical protein
MGLFGDIVDVVIGGLIGGPAGAISVFTIEHGADVVKGSIDVARQIVTIGSDVYRAIPAWAFALGGDPLQGLLKHEAEDEIIWLGQIGANVAIFSGLSWPSLGPVGASLAIAEGAVPLYIAAGSLIGKFHHRPLNDQEWEMARYIFRDTLPARGDIVLTNVGGLGGRAFVYPSTTGSIFVNLGNAYVHNATIVDGPRLFHELTHVWQAKQRALSEIFLYDATVQVTEDDPYPFAPGQQWSSYNIEQQASIVEGWTRGATTLTKSGATHVFDTGARHKFTIGPPLFRYINGNVRRNDRNATTSDGRSVRRLLTDGQHRTIREMHVPPPPVWW